MFWAREIRTCPLAARGFGEDYTAQIMVHIMLWAFEELASFPATVGFSMIQAVEVVASPTFFAFECSALRLALVARGMKPGRRTSERSRVSNVSTRAACPACFTMSECFFVFSAFASFYVAWSISAPVPANAGLLVPAWPAAYVAGAGCSASPFRVAITCSWVANSLEALSGAAEIAPNTPCMYFFYLGIVKI